MKRIILLFISSLLTAALSAQTMMFEIQEIKVKDFAEQDILAAYETCCADMKPNGGFGLQRYEFGGENGMTHRLVYYWELGEDLWEGTNMGEKFDLWSAQMDNYVEEWGERYMGRSLSRQAGTNEDYNLTHIWDFKTDNPNQFKTAHDKIVKTFKKENEGRWIAFGTYDVNYPNGATHWVGVSGFSEWELVALYDKMQNQSEFIKLIAERGKTEDVRDYMVENLITFN